jgi:hypothetical protein
MANFDGAITRPKIASVQQATNLLDLIGQVYHAGKQIQTLLALYQANTDPAFTGAINALYTASERTELGVMLAQINTLVADWAVNHAGAVGG